MTQTTITLSPEVAENLTKLADAAHISMDELAEEILADYIIQGNKFDKVYRPDPQELTELKQSIQESEAEDAEGIYFTPEQVELELNQIIAQVRAKKAK